MSKKVTLILTVCLMLVLVIPGAAQAEDPTGDFAVVQAKIATWLAENPKPVITVDAVFENMSDGDTSNDPFILSVRSPDHYKLGHVPQAVNIPWRQIAKPENLAKLPTDQPITDYCYTGHTGQVAMTALNLMGYPATNMKFGLMAWTKNDEVLGTARFDPATVPDYRVETTPNDVTTPYDFPQLDTGATDEAEIIRLALDRYLSSGKPPVMSSQALFEILSDGDDSNDPVILSVRSPEHYAIGHIPGAINIPWKALGDPANLAKLPPDKPIVVYCYTGHTGQVATTLLNTLGYDATNLKFGMMGWSQDPDVVATKVFAPDTQADYRLEGAPAEMETAPATETPATPADEMILDFTPLWQMLNMIFGYQP